MHSSPTYRSGGLLRVGLKTIVDSDFPDISTKYDEKKYRSIIDGYINKQIAFTGATEGLENQIREIHRNTPFGRDLSTT